MKIMKSLLRQKNHLMNSGQIEKANALANRIGTMIYINKIRAPYF